ncbi:MFS transporter [Nocardia goodfellowii]|uniref:DHA2 family multidrug resistance protein-like MFS transporter n=1 Tax=Nocardia goodfellowii TaxID=882446 RepID=A0ABS4QK32_9NOCA|nr:MFS transporter [Nocardia goodfellowii]MBP2191480.1 DHA2 family multidrug resistance protein-like MFS transporter [Nocardia goodfellowii]
MNPERIESKARWGMLAVLCASVFLVMMDVTILNVALPALISDLRPDPLTQLWIVDIYSLLLGGLLVLCGGLGDRIGRKRMFLAGWVVFALASVLAATAPAAWQLIAGRALCAIGAAMLMPSTVSMIRNIFTDDRERVRAIAVWSAVTGLGAAAGPVVGGLLVQNYGWRAAFWLNVPCAIVLLLVAIPLLPEFRSPSRGSLDWVGAGLSVVGIMTLAWGIKHTAAGGLTFGDVLVLAFAIGLLALFARRQLRLDDPLLDVRLFRRGPFTAATIAIFVPQIALGAMLLLITLWLQYIQGYSPVQAGLRTLPVAFAALVGALVAPRIMDRAGVRKTMGASLVAVIAGFVLLGFAPAPTTYPTIAVVQIALGLGAGVVTTIASSVLVAAVPADRAGQAGAVSETSYDLGQGVGVALLGSIHGAIFAAHMTDLPLTGADLDSARGSVGGAVAVATRVGGQTGEAIMDQARGAFDSALTTTAFVGAGITVLAVLLVVRLTPRDFTMSTSGAEHKTRSELVDG